MPAKDTWEQRIQAVTNGGMEAVVDATIEDGLLPKGVAVFLVKLN